MQQLRIERRTAQADICGEGEAAAKAVKDPRERSSSPTLEWLAAQRPTLDLAPQILLISSLTSESLGLGYRFQDATAVLGLYASTTIFAGFQIPVM
jgi:hypothetical protein